MAPPSHSSSDDEGPARKKLKADAPMVPSRMGSTILMETQESITADADVTMEDDAAKSKPGRPRKSGSAPNVATKSSARSVRGRKSEPVLIEDVEEQDTEVATPKKRGGRKKAEDNAPLPPRANSAWKIGAHVSAAGGPQNAVLNAAKIGAGAFALFLKSQRKWVSPAYKAADIEAFHTAMKTHGYAPEHVLPHGSYLLNLGNPDEAKRQQSYTCFIDDLKRAELLGLMLYNFHPGSTVKVCTREESIAHIATCLNRAHKDTNRVVTVLENMAGQGNVIGSKFEDLRDIIALVEDKTRVGVCIDTCHLFAAGYDIRTRDAYDATMQQFEEIVGSKYLRGMHINDSKFDLAAKKDRHENLGVGKIGLSAFSYIVRDPRTRGIPLVLETPSEDDPGVAGVWAVEVGALHDLAEDTQTGSTPAHASEDIGTLGVAAAAKEEADTETLESMVERISAAARKSNAKKATKAKKPAAKGTKRKKNADEDEDEDEDDD